MNRHEALTSKQIMLILSALWLIGAASVLGGCQNLGRVETVKSPYERRQVFAVAPLRNESGSSSANGVRLADRVAQQLALTRGIDVLPVNRVLGAMERMGIGQVTDRAQALELRRRLGVDGLVIGSVTAYDPYAPPTLGLALELYIDGRRLDGPRLDPRRLSRSATNPAAAPPRRAADPRQPVSAIAGFYDAADPDVDDLLWAYARQRGPDRGGEMTRRRHRISMDLYSQFVSYQLIARLMDAEELRLERPENHRPAPLSTNPQTSFTPGPPPRGT